MSAITSDPNLQWESGCECWHYGDGEMQYRSECPVHGDPT